MNVVVIRAVGDVNIQSTESWNGRQDNRFIPAKCVVLVETDVEITEVSRY